MNDKKTQRLYQNSNHSENCSAKSDKKGLQTSDRTNEFDTKQKKLCIAGNEKQREMANTKVKSRAM